MTFQAILPQRLYQQVADQIAGRIRAGDFSPGCRLPAERDLSKQIGVSRPTLREAMIALEIAGLVEVRTGAGIFVVKSGKVPATIADAGRSPFDLLSARRAVEGETSATAARTVTSAALAQMERTLGELVTAIRSGARSYEQDRAFHLSIAAATGNPVLEEIVDTLWVGMANLLFRRLEQRFPVDLESNAKAHETIYWAISTGDPHGARSAMHAHLDHIASFFMEEASVSFKK